MKNCTQCKGKMAEKKGKTPDNISYTYHQCTTCGEEILDMQQLHDVAEKYRVMKKYRVKISTWGVSKGIRIPKELISRYKFKDEVSLIPEENGLRIAP